MAEREEGIGAIRKRAEYTGETPDVEEMMARQRKISGQDKGDDITGTAEAATPTTPAAPEVTPTATPTPGAPSPEAQKDVHLQHVNSAVSSLEQALTAVGSSSPAGRAILDTLRTLSKHFGEQKQPGAIDPNLRNLISGQNQ